MSKELDKFKKEFKPLEKAAGDLEQQYASHGTNREHHKQMLLESAKEIGRVVQTLKDAGKTGSSLKDFANEKDMMPVMKTALNALDALGKEESRLKKILKDTSGALKDLQKLEAAISKEVLDRKKKKDRKIAAVDSKSLPEMEKLLTTVGTLAVDLDMNIIQMQKTEEWSLEKENKNFDKWCTQEIAKTKSDRKARDTAETDDRAFDDRVLKRHMGEVKKLIVAVQTACGKAEKHFKNKELKEADAQLQAAWDYHAALKKIYEPYQRKLARMNSHDMKSLQMDKTGKAMLASIDQMAKAVDALAKLIKKFSRATV